MHSASNSSPTKAAVQPAVLRLNDLATYLSISRSFAHLLVKRCELPHVVLGGRAIGVLRTDADEWLQRQRVTSIAAPQSC